MSQLLTDLELIEKSLGKYVNRKILSCPNPEEQIKNLINTLNRVQITWERQNRTRQGIKVKK